MKNKFLQVAVVGAIGALVTTFLIQPIIEGK